MPVVEKLHRDGWRLGVITQRGRSGAESFLREHGLAEMFPVIVAGDDGHGRKPGPSLNTTPRSYSFKIRKETERKKITSATMAMVVIMFFLLII